MRPEAPASPCAFRSPERSVEKACKASSRERRVPRVRIAIVSDYYYPQLGGITEHVHGQATELTRRGHDVTLTPSPLPAPPSTASQEPLPQRTFELERVGRA